mmetsp:Transcript_8166/g.23473  ORF Transcript_8166/g.23473 Transcript_8166/m.23473 type:complete len:297 (+) Transcript_8166:481-1371(+)
MAHDTLVPSAMRSPFLHADCAIIIAIVISTATISDSDTMTTYSIDFVTTYSIDFVAPFQFIAVVTFIDATSTSTSTVNANANANVTNGFLLLIDHRYLQAAMIFTFPILVIHPTSQQLPADKPIAVQAGIFDAPYHPRHLVVLPVVLAGTQRQRVRRQHPMQVAEDDVRQQPVANHAQLGCIFNVEMLQHLLQASRLLLVVLDDRNAQLLLNFRRVLVAGIVQRPRAVAHDRDVGRTEDRFRILQPPHGIRMQEHGVRRRQRVVLVEHHRPDPALRLQRFVVEFRHVGHGHVRHEE